MTSFVWSLLQPAIFWRTLSFDFDLYSLAPEPGSVYQMAKASQVKFIRNEVQDTRVTTRGHWTSVSKTMLIYFILVYKATELLKKEKEKKEQNKTKHWNVIIMRNMRIKQ